MVMLLLLCYSYNLGLGWQDWQAASSSASSASSGRSATVVDLEVAICGALRNLSLS